MSEKPVVYAKGSLSVANTLPSLHPEPLHLQTDLTKPLRRSAWKAIAAGLFTGPALYGLDAALLHVPDSTFQALYPLLMVPAALCSMSVTFGALALAQDQKKLKKEEPGYIANPITTGTLRKAHRRYEKQHGPTLIAGQRYRSSDGPMQRYGVEITVDESSYQPRFAVCITDWHTYGETSDWYKHIYHGTTQWFEDYVDAQQCYETLSVLAAQLETAHANCPQGQVARHSEKDKYVENGEGKSVRIYRHQVRTGTTIENGQAVIWVKAYKQTPGPYQEIENSKKNFDCYEKEAAASYVKLLVEQAETDEQRQLDATRVKALQAADVAALIQEELPFGEMESLDTATIDDHQAEEKQELALDNIKRQQLIEQMKLQARGHLR